MIHAAYATNGMLGCILAIAQKFNRQTRAQCLHRDKPSQSSVHGKTCNESTVSCPLVIVYIFKISNASVCNVWDSRSPTEWSGARASTLRTCRHARARSSQHKRTPEPRPTYGVGRQGSWKVYVPDAAQLDLGRQGTSWCESADAPHPPALDPLPHAYLECWVLAQVQPSRSHRGPRGACPEPCPVDGPVAMPSTAHSLCHVKAVRTDNIRA